ncbi:hypothetical protein [Nitrosomonas communis]|uniref:hypothetical protein n=1 Tax=Nitrosomonas communis TaxID=44574 RepID=UPI003D28960D
MAHLNECNQNIKSFGAEIEAESARSITLLRNIENTIFNLNSLTKKLHNRANYAEGLIAFVENIENEIDQDDSISDQLEIAQNRINDLYNELIIKRQAGRIDRRLTNEDGIEDAYTEAIEASADLHNLLNTLRWAINEHDADRSQPEESFTDADELIKYLNK